MARDDFSSAFQDVVTRRLPPSPYACNTVAQQALRHSQRWTRVLAGLSLFFWIVGAAGALLLAVGLDRLVISLRVPASAGWSADYGGTVGDRAPLSEQQMLWGTDLIHHSLPFVEGAIVALPLAALFTVLLVFSSRKTTIAQINRSLLRISEQLKDRQVEGRSDSANSDQPLFEKSWQPNTRKGAFRRKGWIFAASSGACIAAAMTMAILVNSWDRARDSDSGAVRFAGGHYESATEMAETTLNNTEQRAEKSKQ